VEPPLELSVPAQFDEDYFVEAEAHEVEWFGVGGGGFFGIGHGRGDVGLSRGQRRERSRWLWLVSTGVEGLGGGPLEM